MQPTSTIAAPQRRTLRLIGEDQRIPTIDGRERVSINLDAAASTPPLVAVHEAVERFVPWYSSIHRGAGYRSQVASRAYEGARAAVADLVDAADDQVVVLVRNTTEALNVLASALSPELSAAEVPAGRPSGAVRVSIGIGVGEREVDTFLAAVRSIAEDGPRAEYALDPATRQLVPRDDPRPWPELGLRLSGARRGSGAPCL